jgi:transcriptional regulator with XRE-family HTH domain
MKLKELQKKLRKNPEYNKALEELDFIFKFADAILEARLGKGWTQSELAREVGTKQANISRIESGIANPTTQIINRLIKVLNIDVSFGKVPDPNGTVTTYVGDFNQETIGLHELSSKLMPANMFETFSDRENTSIGKYLQ